MSTSTSTSCRYAAIHYVPSVAGNVIVGTIYILLCALFAAHQLRWRKNEVPGWKWAWVLPAGSLASGIGYFIRLMVDPCNFKMGTFIAQQLFIILAPCLFIAFQYAMFGRFIAALKKPGLSWIAPHKVSKIFIWSDVITFMIQGGAGGLQASGGSMQVWGSRAFLLGVALQCLSFLLFSSLVITAHYRAMANGQREIQDVGINTIRNTIRILWAFQLTNILYLVRCTFRVLEFAFGYDGFLMKSEAYLLGLDAAPILLALLTWIIFYPLQAIHEITNEEKDSASMAVLTPAETIVTHKEMA